MTSARFGDEKKPMPIPLTSRISANGTYPKLIGSISSSRKLAAETSMPPVANHRAPNLSESTPDSGADTRKPTVSGSM